MLFLLGAEEDTVAVVSTLLMLAMCVPLMIPVFLTERRLKETFDDHGNRILPGDPADLDQM